MIGQEAIAEAATPHKQRLISPGKFTSLSVEPVLCLRSFVDLHRYQGDIDGFVEGYRRMSDAGSNATHNIAAMRMSLNKTKGFSISVGNIVTRFMKKCL